MRLRWIDRAFRLPQRISLLFFLCVMIPVTMMVTFSVLSLESEIEGLGMQRLRHQAKSISLNVYERLVLLETEMRLYAFLWASSPGPPPMGGPGEEAPGRLQGFESLCRITPQGAAMLLGGGGKPLPPFPAPALSGSGQRGLQPSAKACGDLERAAFSTIGEHYQEPQNAGSQPETPFFPSLSSLPQGQAVIRVVEVPGAPAALLMALATSPEECLVGWVRADYLWGTDTGNELPLDVDALIVDENNRVLSSSMEDPAPLLRRLAAGVVGGERLRFSWRRGAAEHFATASTLFLAARFSAGSWTIVLSQSQDSMLGTLRRFEWLFALIGLLMVLTAAFVSMVSIRRSLEPLANLGESTRWLAEGNFSIRVPIRGSPEFRELSNGFNRMSAHIEKQFKQLSLLAAIGQKLAAVRETEALAEALIDSLRRYLDFDRVLFITADAATHAVGCCSAHRFDAEEVEEFCRGFSAATDACRIDPARLCFDAQKMLIWEDPRQFGFFTAEAELGFFRRIGVQTLVCVPVVHEQVSLGVIVLACTSAARAILPNERELLHGIASAVAVGIAGIASYRRLRESEERFRQAFEHSAAGVALIDCNGALIQVNPFLSAMLGRGGEALLGRRLTEIAHAEDRAALRDAQQGLLDGRPPGAPLQIRFVCRKGRIAWGLVSSSLLRDGSGRPLHFVAHIQDITAQKEAQLESESLEAQLRHAQKMEAIGTLAAGIAHDFNNVLAAITGYIELASLDLPEESDTRQRLDKALQACNRAAELIKQILAFSRHGEEKKGPVQVSAVVKEALKLLRSTIPPHIAISQHISNAPLAVLSDPTQIHQLVMNLCTNAYHAMLGRDTGVIAVTLVPEKTPAESPEAVRTFLKLTVSDNGCGMPPAVLERIFEPYFTTKKAGMGTGLGLSIVHGIVKKHGGEISVRSKPGEGTAFEIRFPAIEIEPPPSAASAAAIPAGRESILVVDDEKEIAAIYREMLSHQGYRVESRSDPHEALDEFQQNPERYQLVITDFAMPGMTGERLASEIAAIRPGLPIILCSGYLDEARTPSDRGLFREFLKKPVNMAALAETVRRAIDAPAA
jgi:PAS domain S-box-containing protein